MLLSEKEKQQKRLYISSLTRLSSNKLSEISEAGEEPLECNAAAVSWARIEHCGPADLDGYKAARAPTLSASQLNFVSQSERREGGGEEENEE